VQCGDNLPSHDTHTPCWRRTATPCAGNNNHQCMLSRLMPSTSHRANERAPSRSIWHALPKFSDASQQSAWLRARPDVGQSCACNSSSSSQPTSRPANRQTSHVIQCEGSEIARGRRNCGDNRRHKIVVTKRRMQALRRKQVRGGTRGSVIRTGHRPYVRGAHRRCTARPIVSTWIMLHEQLLVVSAWVEDGVGSGARSGARGAHRGSRHRRRCGGTAGGWTHCGASATR
jgi:hypothetical protein